MKIADHAALKEGIARMCSALEEMGVPVDAVFSSKVVAHELLTNALEYGGGEARFSFRLSGNSIRISVRAKYGFEPPKKIARADLYAECGRGLYLVDALSERREYSEEEGVCAFVPFGK